MENSDKIKECYQAAQNYPDLAKKLNERGVESYTVDTASGAIWYRFAKGEKVLHQANTPARRISENFNETGTIEAIRRNQQDKSDYPGFMDEIAEAGVRFYKASLSGETKNVTSVGIGGVYEEPIPW